MSSQLLDRIPYLASNAELRNWGCFQFGYFRRKKLDFFLTIYYFFNTGDQTQSLAHARQVLFY
jgi:hypothetical protein